MSVFGRIGNVVDRLGGFVEVPEVARYLTLPGVPQGFTIPAGEAGLSDRHFQDLDAPGLIDGAQSVLFLRTSNGGTSRFSVRVNSASLIQHKLTGDEPSPLSWHVLIPAGALKTENNELVFGVPAGGRVHFSDVVIMYRSNKLTVKRPIVDPIVNA